MSSNKLSEYVRNGDGVIQVDSMFADLSKMVIEKLSGNDKFKKHRKISNAPVRFFRFFFLLFSLYIFFVLLIFISRQLQHSH